MEETKNPASCRITVEVAAPSSGAAIIDQALTVEAL
jgi:hypothetical protein